MSLELTILEALCRKLVEIGKEVEEYAEKRDFEMARDRIVKSWMLLSRMDRVLAEWHNRLYEEKIDED